MGIGLGIAVNVVTETVEAKLGRNIKTTAGNATVVAHATVLTTAQAHASAAGGDNDDKDGSGGDDSTDDRSNQAVNSNSNRGSDRTVPQGSESQSSGNGQASSESGSGGDGVGIAAAAAVNAATVTATAHTTSGADIEASGLVRVGTEVSLDAWAQSDATAVDLQNGNVNVGAALSLNVVNLTETATIGTGSHITGDGIIVDAITTGDETNAYSASAYAAAGNKSGTVAGAAVLALNVVNYKVSARTDNGAELDSTAGINVTAEHDMSLVAVGASGAFSADGTALGGAVAMNLVNIGDNSGDPYDTGTFAGIGDDAGVGHTHSASGAVSVTADTNIAAGQVDLPQPINDFGISDPDIHVSTLALAGGGSSGASGIAGSVSINWWETHTSAFIDNNANLTAGSLMVSAHDDFTVTGFAGAVGAGLGGAGVAAGLDLLILNRDTRAFVGTGTVVNTSFLGSATIKAESDENIFSLVANAGVGDSAGVAGSAAVQVINKGTGAGTHAYILGSVTASGNLRVDADGTFNDKMIAGAIGAASTAGVGVSNTTLVQTHRVEAYVGDNATASSTFGNVTVEATSAENVLGVTATAGAAGTVAVGGSVTVAVVEQITEAHIGRGATSNAGGDIYVHADAGSVMTGVAGSLAASGSASVGVGVDIGTLTKTTRAFIDSGVNSEVGGDLLVIAKSTEDITSVVVGFAFSGSASVTANPSISVFDITTKAHIGDDPEIGPAALLSGSINVDGSIQIDADDTTEIDKVSAGAAVSAGAGIALSANVTVLNKHTDAFIGDGASVTARGAGDGVTSALGVITHDTAVSTPGTNSIEAQGSSTYDGDAASVGASAEVGAAAIDDDGSKEEATDAAKSSVEVTRTTGRAATNVHGIAISSTNSDDIETYSIAAGGGVVGVAVSGAVNVVNATTRAYVGEDASVNSSLDGADSGQSVRIGAGNDFHHVAVTAAAAGGFVGVAPAVDVTVTDTTVKAEIRDGALVNAVNDVTVDAYNAEDLVVVTLGVGGGFVGVGAGVSVISITDVIEARIGDATVYAGDSVRVRANADSDFVLVDGAGGGGFVGGGAGVGVVLVDKTTHAIIDDGATVDAIGGGSGLGGTLTGDLSGGDAADGFDTATVTGVVVQATSSENLTHVAFAVGAGFVGISGAVAVTVMDSDTLAEIGNADVNTNNVGQFQNVYVNAANETRLQTIVGAIAGGVAGVGGAVDVGVIRNDVGAKIRSGADVRAGNDVEVNALAIKELDGFTASASGGVVGLGAAISVWSVGTPIDDEYDGQKPAQDGDISAQDDAGHQSSDAVDKSNSLWSGYGSGATDSDNPANRSRSESSSAMSSALTGVNSSNRPTYNANGPGDADDTSSVAGSVESADPTAGTEAIIESGASVSSGTSLFASGDIRVNAKADVEVDMFIGQFALGLVGAGAAVGISSIHEAVTASAGGTLWADGGIYVDAALDSELNFTSVAGQGGLVGVGASVVVLSDTSAVLAEIAGGAVIDKAGIIHVNAVTYREITSFNIGVQVAGVAVGASLSDVEIGGSVTAKIGANAFIGQGEDSVGSVVVTAHANETGTLDTDALAGGVAGATVNFADLTIDPTVLAEIGDGALVTTTGDITVEAISNMGGESTVTGIAISGVGSLAASVADVLINPNVTARIGTAGISAGGLLKVRSTHNEGNSRRAKATSAAGSGSLGLAGSGADSDATSSAKVYATVGGNGASLHGGSGVLIETVANNQAEAITESVGIGLVAGIGISSSTAVTDGASEATIVDGTGSATNQKTTVTGAGLTVNAISLDRGRAVADGAAGGLFAGGGDNTSVVIMSPQVIAEIGAYTDVNVGGAVTVVADSVAEGDAATNGVTGSGFASIGSSDSRVTVGDYSNLANPTSSQSI